MKRPFTNAEALRLGCCKRCGADVVGTILCPPCWEQSHHDALRTTAERKR